MLAEFELKAVVRDPAACIASIERAGGRLVERGLLSDQRWDMPDGRLSARDEVLRIREFRGTGSGGEGTAERHRASLDWKGPTSIRDGYKVRDETSTPVDSAATLRVILSRLGFEVTQAIDREITAFDVAGAHARLERYPLMDVLIEVEGPPEAIERAIEATGLPRAEFTSERLSEFAIRFERRTGQAARLSGYFEPASPAAGSNRG